MGSALIIAQQAGQGGPSEAVWIALIANIALVLVAMINGAFKVRKISDAVNQVNDAVNHRHPSEPRLLDIVKMTHEQAMMNAQSHERLGAEVGKIKLDLNGLGHKVDVMQENLDCVDRKVTDHIEWEENGGKYGPDATNRERRVG